MASNKFEDDVRDVFHLTAYIKNSYGVESSLNEKGGIKFTLDGMTMLDLFNDNKVELSNTMKRLIKTSPEVLKAGLEKVDGLDNQ